MVWPPTPEKERKMRMAKNWIRLTAIFLALLASILTAAALAVHSLKNQGLTYDDGDTLVNVSLLYVGLLMSLFWNLTDVLILYFKHYGIHPGAHIAVDLGIVAALLTVSLFANYGSVGGFHDEYGYTMRNGKNARDYPSIAAEAGLEKTSIVITWMLSFIHMALFIWSCIDVDIIVKKGKRSQSVELADLSRRAERAERLAEDTNAKLTALLAAKGIATSGSVKSSGEVERGVV